MLRGFLYLTFLFSALSSFSQIVLNNPSFENGNGVCSNTGMGFTPLHWNECNIRIANCIPDQVTVHPSVFTINGDYILFLRYDYGFEEKGAIAQHIPCGFNQTMKYNFNLWHSGFYNDAFPGLFVKGRLHIWLGSDTCDYAQLIYRTEPLDTVWQNGQVSFIPNQDYSWLLLAIDEVSDTSKDKASNVWVDHISPIYIINGNEIEATTPDTFYLERKSECINLSATASATMDSVWWEQVGVGIISQQLNAGVVCVDSNTTFIVHGIGTDSTCAGYLPSSDTVRVRFYDPTSNQPEVVQKTMFKVYPNPSKDYFTIEAEQSGTFQLYNSLGQLVLTKAMSKGTYATLDVSEFGSGVYYYNFLSDGKAGFRGKLVKE